VSKFAARLVLGIVFAFLYLPIVVMIVFSFNSGSSTAVFDSFSFQPFVSLFTYHENLMISLRNSLILAGSVSVISTVFGTLATVAIFNSRNKRIQSTMMGINKFPMMNPHVVTGVSMMLMFIFISNLLGSRNTLSFTTVLLAHVTITTPFVVLNVMPKLREADPHMLEAAYDLGCTPLRAFFKVTLPTISTGIISGLMMAFALSLDDFIISFYTTGTGFQTFPIEVFNQARRGIRPPVFALSTLIFITIFTLLVLSNYIQIKSEKKKGAKS